MASTRADSLLVDLHTHTNHSDGTQSPVELVAAAAQAGVDVLGLTDHDSVTGWTSAAGAASEAGVAIVPGVELSAHVRGMSVHLLAYLVDPDDTELTEMTSAIRSHRCTRMRRTVDMLAADGYPVDYDSIVREVGPHTTLGRPHVADALVRAGCFTDRDAVFAQLLHSSGPYYVRHWAPSAVEAVAVIRAAGGVPVLAHPFAWTRGRTVTETDVDDLVNAGLLGLEVHHPDHTDDAVAAAAAICGRHGLLETGASDYHGTGKSSALAQCTTSPEQLQRLLALGTGTPTIGAPL